MLSIYHLVDDDHELGHQNLKRIRCFVSITTVHSSGKHDPRTHHLGATFDVSTQHPFHLEIHQLSRQYQIERSPKITCALIPTVPAGLHAGYSEGDVG